MKLNINMSTWFLFISIASSIAFKQGIELCHILSIHGDTRQNAKPIFCQILTIFVLFSRKKRIFTLFFVKALKIRLNFKKKSFWGLKHVFLQIFKFLRFLTFLADFGWFLGFFLKKKRFFINFLYKLLNNCNS